MLEMKNVTKAFGAFKALDDLSPRAAFTVWWAPTARARPR